MKLSTFCLTANFETPELQVGKIKFRPEVQTHIYNGDNGIGIEHEIADFEDITVDGLPCNDFQKLMESYNSMGVDIDSEMDRVTFAYIEEHFDKEKYTKLGEYIKSHQGSIDLRKEQPIEHRQLVLDNFNEALELVTKSTPPNPEEAREKELQKYITLFPNYAVELKVFYQDTWQTR
jgi:hypothetical protein